MPNLVVGSESFKPVGPEKTIESPVDLFRLYFRNGEDPEFHSILQADSKVFQTWISQHIHIILDPGATELWSHVERFEVIRKCIEKNNLLSGNAIYVKGVSTNVGED